MNDYVRKGAELAGQVYDMMANGESVRIRGEEVGCPTYEGVPHGCLIHGLFVPVRTEKPCGVMEYHNYMELVSLKSFGNPDFNDVIYRNEPAYVWFADNGQAVLDALCKRRNKSAIFLELEVKTREKLEAFAIKEGVELNYFISSRLEALV